jgi:hypothetical protein
MTKRLLVNGVSLHSLLAFSCYEIPREQLLLLYNTF